MAILFDLDGVFYQGERAIDGAADVARWVREQEIPHLFLTNTTSRPRSVLVEKLAGFGIETEEANILTPPVAALNWCRQHIADAQVALYVPELTQSEFADLRTSDADGAEVAAVIVGDLGESWNFQRLNQAFRQLMQNPSPTLIALGMTRYWQAPDGLRLDVAPFVMALSHASGVEPLVMGKPAPAFYDAAVDLLGTRKAETLMIGDDIRGDVEGAQRCGLRALLVRTGKFRPSDLDLPISPDAVLPSVVDLPDWYCKHF